MVTIYHNPRCSKSREALAILNEHNLKPKVVEYLDNPLDRKTLQALVKKLNSNPMQMLRTKDKKFKEAKLDPKAEYNTKEIIDILEKHGHLMERPIVVSGSKAVVARPPKEKIEEIL